MYGYSFDYYTKSECIIPASELTAMEGGTITAITFYAMSLEGSNSTFGTANQKVFLKEVSETTLSSYSGMTDATVVFDGTLPMPTTNPNGYTITFSQGYTYNGGNLLIGIYNAAKGSWRKVFWYGNNNQSSGVSAFGYSAESLAKVGKNNQTFLPKTTFTYTPAPTAVDLGLPSGKKWADMNVGAGSETGIGTYFEWGETTAYDNNNSYSGNNPTTLPLSNDAAYANWGSNWRMPTKAEYDELLDKTYTTWTWYEDYNSTGVGGYLVTSKMNGNSIFLPKTGYMKDGYLNAQDRCDYWSSTINGSNNNNAYALGVGSGDRGTSNFSRSYGFAIRPVQMFAGEGTEASPYLIASTTDWNNLVSAVNAGETYSGNYFKLTANISVTTMIGASEKPFRGSFDGGGHTLTVNYTASAAGTAPFPRTASTTLIKNLHVAGTITSGDFKVAGLVSEPVGATIEHCRVSATISANAYHGLWIGGFCNGGNVTIKNCLFDGKINCVGGGFIGYSEKSSRITNCLFAPQTGSSLGSSQDGNGVFIYTKGRESKDLGTITNCYYTSLANGVAQGTDGSGMTPAQLVENLGPSNWKVVGGNAIPKVHPNLSGEGTEASPYLIASTTDWNNLVSAVNAGEAYSGNYFKMTANVGTVSTWMTGTFSGTFDGDGKTLTVDYSATTEKCAPFGTLGGASIQKLKVAGTITTNQKYAAGIAAYTTGTTYITNCLSSVAISSAVSGDGTHGGLVAVVDDVASLSMTGCAFTGKLLTTNSTTSCGGFVGFRWYTGTLTMTDCLYAPASATGSETWISDGEGQLGNANFSRWSNSTPTFTRCYYTTDFGSGKFTAQGIQARTIAAGDYVSSLSVTKGDATETYAVSGITVYSGGIDFNDGSTTTFYGGSGQSVSLALTAETRSGYQFKQYAASQGSLSGETTDAPTLTMPAASGETTYTSYTATAGTTGYHGETDDYTKLVDNIKTVDANKWMGTFTPGVYAEFNTPNAIVPTGYVITTANDAVSGSWDSRSPKTWKLYGKLHEGDSWTLLDDVADGQLPAAAFTDVSYSIANTAAYKYFRYEISAIKGSTELFQLAELQLKGYDAVVISAEYDPLYNATFASGNDNDGWTISPTQQIVGGTVTVSYEGENKVKSVTVTNKYAIAHSLAESVVGDIVGTDGNAYAVAEKDKLPVGVTAAGVVTYKSGESGIVVALQNLATKYSWNDAFTAAAAYTPAVSGQSWKLGKKDEMSNAILNDYTIKYGYITAAGGTFPYPNNYWSATEVEGYTTERAWRIWLNESNVPAWHDWDGVTKATECQVRPIIAF